MPLAFLSELTPAASPLSDPLPSSDEAAKWNSDPAVGETSTCGINSMKKAFVPPLKKKMRRSVELIHVP